MTKPKVDLSWLAWFRYDLIMYSVNRHNCHVQSLLKVSVYLLHLPLYIAAVAEEVFSGQGALNLPLCSLFAKQACIEVAIQAVRGGNDGNPKQIKRAVSLVHTYFRLYMDIFTSTCWTRLNQQLLLGSVSKLFKLAIQLRWLRNPGSVGREFNLFVRHSVAQ